MPKYNVNKNIEKKARIRGFIPRFYYFLFALRLLSVVILSVTVVVALGRNTLSSYVIMALIIVSVVGVYFGLSKYLKNVSKEKKYNFKKTRQVISNRDLLRHI